MDLLKVYFGTLFLYTFYLPSVNEIKTLLGHDHVHPYLEFPPFDTIECVLQYVLTKVLDKSEYLVNACKTEHDLSFANSVKTFDERIRPHDPDESAKLFFVKFFEGDFTPRSYEEVQQIVEWMLFAVQFDEAKQDRVIEALHLMRQLKLHLFMMKARSDAKKKASQELLKWSEAQKRDVDAKYCSCFEFEISGNCSHEEDLS